MLQSAVRFAVRTCESIAWKACRSMGRTSSGTAAASEEARPRARSHSLARRRMARSPAGRSTAKSSYSTWTSTAQTARESRRSLTSRGRLTRACGRQPHAPKPFPSGLLKISCVARPDGPSAQTLVALSRVGRRRGLPWLERRRDSCVQARFPAQTFAEADIEKVAHRVAGKSIFQTTLRGRNRGHNVAAILGPLRRIL